MATDLLNRRVIRVPNVVGRSVHKARILLEDAGFKKIVTLYRESYEDRDTVLDQRPPRTQMVYEDTEVVIWVARRGYLESLPRSIAGAMRSAATWSASCASCS